LLADKGYDADHFVDSLTARAIQVVIPPKANRKVKRDCDFALYCERNPRRAILLYNQAFSGDRDALREDSPKLSGWTTFGLRVGLA
jgi:transposase